MMDDETRFLIAQEVADTKNNHDAKSLFRKASEVAEKKPTKLVTDGLPAYREAFLKEYWTREKSRVVHESHITLKGDRNNNMMERLNGEIRDREKVVRGLKKNDSPLLDGYQIYHNYIRPHMGLNGKTPAEKCGIKVEGENKWLTLIQNAVHEPKIYKEKMSINLTESGSGQLTKAIVSGRRAGGFPIDIDQVIAISRDLRKIELVVEFERR